MVKNLRHIEAFFSDRTFLLYVLAAVGLLAMPQGWFPYVAGLIAASVVYTYLKGNPGTLKDRNCWRRPEIQRFGVIAVAWTWWVIFSAAVHAGLFDFRLSFFNIGIITLTFAPLFVYLVCAAHSLAAWPKGAAGSNKPEDRKKIQSWTDTTFCGFLVAFIFTVTTIVWFPCGIGSWMNGWLLSAGCDANLNMRNFSARTVELRPERIRFRDGRAVRITRGVTLTYLSPGAGQSAMLVKAVLSLAVISLLWSRATRLSGFLTSWLRLNQGRFRADIYESFLRALRLPKTRLKLKEANGFMKNASLSLFWLACCYLFLFTLVGLSSGPLAQAILGWLDASIADANTGMIYGASANPSLRLFCAAIVALYGTVPLAVTGAVFLPYFRRREIILDADGVFFPDGPYRLSCGFRNMRLWSDLASVDVQVPSKAKDPLAGKLVIKCHSGGKIALSLRQLEPFHLEKFLSAVDENALECRVSDELINLRSRLRAQAASSRTDAELGRLSPRQFQSTIFVPHEPGSWLPDGETRVVRLLASRPLSCVYSVRGETGRLAIAKQFFLADDSPETRALRKCFQREYDLLSRLDHPSISKVLGVFHKEQSTYLLIEHAAGCDLRTLVTSQGARSEEKVIDWALQICEIMTYLHFQDPPILHRDLTPDNLVLAEDGRIRIIDFGAAHQFLEGITGTVIGKQCYVAPEQLQGHAGAASDVYSFGCTLHFLLTGKEPLALTQCNPSAQAFVSTELSDMVRACTEFDERLRPLNFLEVKERLIESREKPVKDLIARFKEVAEAQGLSTNQARVFSLKEAESQAIVLSASPPDSAQDPGVVIKTHEYQEHST
jgi:hypothetical protein